MTAGLTPIHITMCIGSVIVLPIGLPGVYTLLLGGYTDSIHEGKHAALTIYRKQLPSYLIQLT